MQTNNLQNPKQKSVEAVQEQLSIKQQEFNNLSNQQKIQRGLQITRHLIDSQIEKEIVIPDDLQSFTLLSIEVSPFPTQSRKIMKYISTDSLSKFLDKNNFVQVDNYCVVFANVEDLSYHNFENILNLDHLFNTVEFKIKIKKQIKKKVQIFNMEGSMDTLLSLDKLNYYTVPLNNTQRGGKRLIFHSNQLSLSLTKMIEESDFFDKKNFSHINNVFRLNNFAPGDKKFKSHYDTPYADKSNNLYSKYTMIIYLTGNNVIKKGQSPLTIGDIVLDQIKENECIIFDQQCEHEGNAYIDNNKIFIRTELIYNINYMDYNEKVARMFNMACYMTKEPEQQQYSADLFNSCVKMRYKIQEEVQRVYLMKRNLDITYVTEGNYYWFPSDIELQSIALLIILDYFNGKMHDLKNVKIQSKTLPRQNTKAEEESDESIFNFIQATSFNQEILDKDKIKNYQTIEDFVPDSLCDNFIVFKCDCGLGGGKVTSISQFQREKPKAVQKLKSILDQNTVLIFENKIKINYENIVVEMNDSQKNNEPSGKIRLSDFFINTYKKINFASCQCEFDYDRSDIVSFETKKLHTFCLPDISFQTFPNGIKLQIDMFKNGFVHHSSSNFNLPYSNKIKYKENRKNRIKKGIYNNVDYSDVEHDDDDYNEDDEDIDNNNINNDDVNNDDVDDDGDDDDFDEDQIKDDDSDGDNDDGDDDGDDDDDRDDDDKKCQVFEKGGVNLNEKKQNNKKRTTYEEYSHINMKLAKF